MLLKLLIFFMINQTMPANNQTVPGTYPPVQKKYWVPIKRPQATTNKKSNNQKEGSDTGSSYEESPVDLLSQEERVTIMGGKRSISNLPQYHVVSNGETLWDISSRYFGDPWEWPKLWAMNPHITNPHWLFPGTKVFLSLNHTKNDSQTNITPPIAGTKRVDQFVGLKLSDVDESIRNLAVVEDESKRSGVISSSFDGRQLISKGDKVYVKNLKKEDSNIGTYLGIYEEMGPINDPSTGKRLGLLVRIKGEGYIIKKTNNTAVLEVTDSIAPISKGNYVGPIPHKFLDIRITNPPNKKLKGAIIEGFLPKTMYATGDLVIISVGTKQGINPGMPFMIGIKGRGGLENNLLPMGNDNQQKGEDYPWEIEGRGIVLYSHDNLSIGIIRKTYLPIHKKDSVLFGPWESNK